MVDDAEEERRTADAPPRVQPMATGWERDPALRPGTRLAGKYVLEREIGAGGMGVVFAAKHLELEERVALKFLKAASDDLVSRLRREARLAFRMKSEHVARILDVDRLPSGAPYLVLEYLEGADLARVLAQRGPLPVDLAVELLLQACDAMVEAHALGIVHRDLKPSNLFLTSNPGGKPLLKVLDFGIAKATHARGAEASSITTGEGVVGSPAYMAPEQVRGAASADPRSDQWALGIVLFELLTGTLPFASGPASAVCAAIVADTPATLSDRRKDVPPELSAIVARCLEKDPEKRFPSVAALAQALAPFAPATGAAAVDRLERYTATARSDAWRKRVTIAGAALLAGASAVAALAAARTVDTRDRAATSAPLALTSPPVPLVAQTDPTPVLASAAPTVGLADAGELPAPNSTATARSHVPVVARPSMPAPLTAAPVASSVAASPGPPPPAAVSSGDLEERAMSHRR